MLVDDFGYLGVFLGGAIPWLEAITVLQPELFSD